MQPSKLLEMLVVREIAGNTTNQKVILNTLNPGLCHSTLWREKNWVIYILSLLLKWTTKADDRCLVAGAAAGDESLGAYMTDGKVSNGQTTSQMFVFD